MVARLSCKKMGRWRTVDMKTRSVSSSGSELGIRVSLKRREVPASLAGKQRRG